MIKIHTSKAQEVYFFMIHLMNPKCCYYSTPSLARILYCSERIRLIKFRQLQNSQTFLDLKKFRKSLWAKMSREHNRMTETLVYSYQTANPVCDPFFCIVCNNCLLFTIQNKSLDLSLHNIITALTNWMARDNLEVTCGSVTFTLCLHIVT